MIQGKNVECESQLKEKRNKVRKRTILTEVLNDYCSSTSLHGIGYLGAEDKSFAEKEWWIIVFTVSLFVCIYFITRTWIKWTNDPVILSFEKEQILIWDIPFPAVTICPVNKVLRSSCNYIEKFRNMDNLTEEEVWWIIVFTVSLCLCIYLITRTWIKWTNDPVILSFEKEQIPIWDIPFPAVTICPVNKVLRRSYNYTEKFRNRDNLSEEESKKLCDISLVCSMEAYENFIDSFICKNYNITDEDAIANIQKNAPDMHNEMGSVRWQSKKLDDAFAHQITEEGLCFTFNSFGQEDMYTDVVNTTNRLISNKIDKDIDWSLEKGYKHKIKQTDYPRRTTTDGITSGLGFTLRGLTVDIDYVCGMPISGYKIILHNPAEVPKAGQQYFLVPDGKKANIVIKPELTKTSELLRSLSAETRKCYFSDEKFLKYFKVYTQSNCRMECKANITLQYCDCVPFYLPREVNTPICGYGSKECTKEIERTILELEMLDKEKNMTEEDKKRIEFTMEIYNKCHCLPSCNSLEYSAEISQSEYHLLPTILASGVFDNILEQAVIQKFHPSYLRTTHVNIFFKESQFYALKRSEIYGNVDFLANVGGLLGLFMGFSLLSLIEIIYFLTIRIWFKYKRSNTIC